MMTARVLTLSSYPRAPRLGGLVLAGALSLAACAAPTDEEGGTSAQAVVDQSSSDTTVLEASVVEQIGGNSPGFDATKCTPTTTDRMDCTAELERRFKTPSLHDIDLENRTGDGRHRPGSSFMCGVLHVVTASKRAAVDASAGIGFYYRGFTGSGRFVPKDQLKKVGELTLKDGSPADLHEFVGLANCWLGSATSSMQATYDFKPYIAFEANGERYNNWDPTPGNHTVSTRYFRWDRKSDLAR